MELADTVVVVTGGASGIGRYLAEGFAERGARGVVVADTNIEWAERVAAGIGGLAVACDVGDPAQITALVARTEDVFGSIDVFCSNAGYSDPAPGDLSGSPDDFRRITDVNLLAHVWAAQAVVPSMVQRGGGYLLQTVSSAGLITGPSGPGYTLTKHGALGFAEWLALNYGTLGVRVSCLCPNAVYTGMFGRPFDATDAAPLPTDSPLGEVLMPEDVAAQVLAAMETDEPFLITPHERVRDSFRRKADDYDAWIVRTSQRLQRMRDS
ncbi:MAG TPA: SDR family oxidoreductase [Ilumatobacter sp.]|nr:SDR family oxidoreductase [Ilumatobacter sp.]